MRQRVIKTEKEYSEALKRIEEIFHAKPGTDLADELELLVTLVELYEKKHYPIDPPTPVEAIKFRMEQAGLTRKDLEKYIGSKSKVSEVLNGKRPLSLKMIRALHKGLCIPADVLLAEPGSELPEDHSDLQWEKFPINEMLERGWFAGFKGVLSDAKDRAEELIREFLKPAGQLELLPAMYRQNVRSGSSMDSYSLLAWTARIVNLAQQENLPDFERGTIDARFMENLRRLSYFDDGPILAKEFLAKRGVYLIVEPHLPKTHLDGAALFAPSGNPIVALTFRHDRLDNFWFSLFHELAHITLHLEDNEKDLFLDELYTVEKSERESEADKWAAEMLLHSKEIEEFALLTEIDPSLIRKKAELLSIHPAIIAGRIRLEQNNFRLLSSLVGYRKVRRFFPNPAWN